MFDDLKKKIDFENEMKEEQREEKKKESKAEAEKEETEDESGLKFNTNAIYSRSQMLKLLHNKAAEMKRTFDDKLFVGTVGYPNVGKSSLINVLFGRKRVGVAAMPGKTKHF